MSNKEYTKNVEKAVTEFRRKRIPHLKKITKLQAEIVSTKKELKKELTDICDKYGVSSSLVSRIIK